MGFEGQAKGLDSNREFKHVALTLLLDPHSCAVQ